MLKDVNATFTCDEEEAKKLCKKYGIIATYDVNFSGDCKVKKYTKIDFKEFLKKTINLYDFRQIVSEWDPNVRTGIVMETYKEDYQSAELEKRYLVSLLRNAEPLPRVIHISEPENINPKEGHKLLLGFFGAILLTILGVSGFIYLRYNNVLVSIGMIITMLCEVILILGFASLIGWKLDIGALIGLICAIGTGVDDQIIIAGEYLKSIHKHESLRRSFFLIYLSAGCMLAVTLPLFFLTAGIPKIVGYGNRIG
jgi:preprotein translocase subunit SecD